MAPKLQAGHALAVAVIFALVGACSDGPGPLDAALPPLDAGGLDAATMPQDSGSPLDADLPDAQLPDTGPPPADAGLVNEAPQILSFEATPSSGLAPLDVQVRWQVYDPDEDELQCTLEPGSGQPDRSVPCTSSAAVSLRYVQPGEVIVRLRVDDTGGAQASAQLSVIVQRPFELPTYLDADYARAGTLIPDVVATATVCQVAVSAAPGADITADLRTAVSSAAALAPAEGHCVVQLPAGAYVLSNTVSLEDGVVISGQGAAQTTLNADFSAASPAILARGGAADLSYEGEEVRGLKGTRELTVTATLARQITQLLAGSRHVYGEVSIDNDPTKFPSEWERPYSAFGIGQVFEVLAVQGLVLTLDRPLNEPYVRAGLARRLELRSDARIVERVGVADLRIVRVRNHHVGTVSFDRTAHAFLLRVALEKTGWAHLYVDRSLACAVHQSYFFDAHDFGDGGRGYGVNLRRHTTGCLIEDNNFRRLRHAMILGVGANGNVIAYNYSEDSRDNISWLKADISLHGHYTHMNLIEGNVVEKIHVSDWWGPAPFHTVFNNRVSRGGVYVDDRSHECAVIDNISEANFPLERALQIHSSIRTLLCVHNLSPSGMPLSSSHRECDDENDPVLTSERPRPASFYRRDSLFFADDTIPAQRRLLSGAPVPAP